MMKIAIGSDHGGYELKASLVGLMKKMKYDIKDYGTHSKESCDYPLIGFEVASAVGAGRADRGVLLCKSGIGMGIIANKVHGVRAAVCYDKPLAISSREHNDCNVIVLAASYTKPKKAKEILKAWLVTGHLGDRHARRVRQIGALERKAKGRLK